MFLQSPASSPIAVSSSGDNTIVSAVTGKKIRVLGYLLNGSGAVNGKWKSGASTDKTGLLYMAAAGGGALAPLSTDPEAYWFETAAGEALVLNLSGATAVGGHVTYIVI